MRDLEEDLKICEAATPGPIRITPCGCNYTSCTDVFISISRSDGRLTPEDARFVAEARTGWSEAIQRAMIAEKELQMLKNTLSSANETCPHGDHWDDCPDCRH